MDILDPDRGKMTIYGSDFQQVNLTPNEGASPTVKLYHYFINIKFESTCQQARSVSD